MPHKARQGKGWLDLVRNREEFFVNGIFRTAPWHNGAIKRGTDVANRVPCMVMIAQLIFFRDVLFQTDDQENKRKRKWLFSCCVDFHTHFFASNFKSFASLPQ